MHQEKILKTSNHPFPSYLPVSTIYLPMSIFTLKIEKEKKNESIVTHFLKSAYLVEILQQMVYEMRAFAQASELYRH